MAENSTGGTNMEKDSRVGRYVQETGVDVRYGEKTWRPVQSVIDLVQNHLDANTTVYEKRLLGLVGIYEYDPENKDQQKAVSLLDGIKYGKPEVSPSLYTQLQRTVGSSASLDDLMAQLQEVDYQIPRMRLKVANGGGKTQFVDYSQMTSLPDSWQVVGFRLDDSGSGFDYKLLGIMGGSTKRESSGKRGGLGEGLKMSVTHLARAGAHIRLLSRNEDQLWISKPKIQDGTVVFEGIKRTGANSDITGSLTDVDFSNPNFDPKLREEIATTLDPRKGEGVGKYVLELRDRSFVPITNVSTEIESLGVPKGRVYVKGLLVEEADNLLFSYNLGEKWAISGRDRKTVQKDVLTQNIKTILGDSEDVAMISKVLAAVVLKESTLEVQTLGRDLQLGSRQEEIWRQTVTDAFNFIPGSTLFIPDNLSTTDQRLLQEKGYNTITIPSVHMNAVALFEKLFLGQVISYAQFITDQRSGLAAQQSKDLNEPKAITQRKLEASGDTPVSIELAERLETLKGEFILMLADSVISRLKKGLGHSVVIDMQRLVNLKFVKAGSHYFSEGSMFDYNLEGNTMYVKDDSRPDFSGVVDMYVQLLKTATATDVFKTVNQGLATQLAADAVASLKPQAWEAIQASGAVHKIERPVTYPPQKQEQDQQLTSFFRQLEVINTPNITLEQVKAAIEEMGRISADYRQTYKTSIPIANKIVSDTAQINELFYSNGVVYLVSISDSRGYTLSPFPGSTFPSREPSARGILDIGRKGGDSFQLKPETLGWIQRIFSGRKDKGDVDISKWVLGKDLPKESPPQITTPEVLPPGQDEYTLRANKPSFLPFELNSGESMHLSFIEGDKEIQLIIKRRGDKVFATKIHDGHSELVTRGTRGYFDGLVSSSFQVFNNVVRINPRSESRVVINKGEQATQAETTEQNRGKDFISSNITLDYGGEVWRDPKRILLDAIQNHIDAQKGKLPDITYSIIDSNNQMQTVTGQQLQDMDSDWKIIGVDIKDTGDGFTTPFLTLLGRSTKTDEDLGKYGEGLKMLAASATRQGISVEFGSRDWIAKPVNFQQEVKDYETGKARAFEMLGYQLTWQDQPTLGSLTRFSVGANPNTQQGATWQNWVEVLDPRNIDSYGQRGLDRFVLGKSDTSHSDGVVSVLLTTPGRIYEKGLLITGGATKPMIFGYNLDETVIDTRERNTYNEKLLEAFLADYYANLTDVDIMRKVLETARDEPQVDFYEYKFLGFGHEKASDITKTLWRKTYHEVFGDDAVLSLRPELHRMQAFDLRMSMNSSGIGTRDQGRANYIANLARAVANEVHLENRNLQILPESLTIFLRSQVYNSEDFLKDIQSSEVELPAQEQVKLLDFVQNANMGLLTILESIDSSSERRQYLHRIIPEDQLRDKKEAARRVKPGNVRVKNPTFPVAGMVEDEDGEAVVFLNQRILPDPERLLEVSVHEMSHFISGKGDFRIDFQRFMMMVALSVQRTRGVVA